MEITQTPFTLPRRALLAGLAALAPAQAFAALPASRKLAFAVFRNGTRIGEQVMSFGGSEAAPVVETSVDMTVKIGPVPVYRYRHRATERWAGGAFESLETTTNANGKAQKVSARREGGRVTIETEKTRLAAPDNAAPLTHWNSAALSRPLFNPQLGKLLKVSVSRGGAAPVKLASGASVSAVEWSVRGDAQIDNWYDTAGVWTALRGKLEDGSTMEYRRF